jgi:hypothetical protein
VPLGRLSCCAFTYPITESVRRHQRAMSKLPVWGTQWRFLKSDHGGLGGGSCFILCFFELATCWLVLDDELLFCLVLELVPLVNVRHARISTKEESAQMAIS